MQCGILDWMFEQKKDTDGKMGEVYCLVTSAALMFIL